jgi:hypothetical protein
MGFDENYMKRRVLKSQVNNLSKGQYLNSNTFQFLVKLNTYNLPGKSKQV